MIGDGPDRPALERAYPSAVFLGFKFGVELAEALSSADVFVFPSRTDTFGLVMLEAMACGTPVAAYPVTGPIDVVAPRRDRRARRGLGQGGARGARARSRRLPARGERLPGSAPARSFSVTSCARDGHDLAAPVAVTAAS